MEVGGAERADPLPAAHRRDKDGSGLLSSLVACNAAFGQKRTSDLGRGSVPLIQSTVDHDVLLAALSDTSKEAGIAASAPFSLPLSSSKWPALTDARRRGSGTCQRLAPTYGIAAQAAPSQVLREAFRLFLQCAEAGNNKFESMLSVGYFYDLGLGVKKSATLAMLWYKRGYRRGSWASATNIATMYRDMKRPRLSYQWYCRAAKLGDGDAEVDIAKHLMDGRGVRRSIPGALAALKRAQKSKLITEAGLEEAAALEVTLRQDRKRERKLNH